jgi:hypothetical protein
MVESFCVHPFTGSYWMGISVSFRGAPAHKRATWFLFGTPAWWFAHCTAESL